MSRIIGIPLNRNEVFELARAEPLVAPYLKMTLDQDTLLEWLLGMENTDENTLKLIRKGGSTTKDRQAIRLLRDNVVIYEGKMSSLRRFKEDVKDVASGYECGIGLENYNDIKVGDIIEAFEIEKVAATL